MTISEEDKDRSFQLIRPACVALIEERDSGRVEQRAKELELSLTHLPDSYVQEFQDYLLLPLRLFLRQQDLPENGKIAIFGCLTRVLQRSRLENWSATKEILTRIFLTISSVENADVLLGSEKLKIGALQCLHSLSVHCSDGVLREFRTSVAVFGHAVYVLLRVCAQEKCVQLRTSALDCLLSVTREGGADDADWRDSVALIFPGVVTTATKVATEDATLNHDVVVRCLRLWSQLVRSVLADSRQESSVRTAEWIKDTSSKVEQLITVICATLPRHGHAKVREALLVWTRGLLTDCSTSFSSSIPALVDVLVALASDSFPDVATGASSALRANREASFSESTNRRIVVDSLQESLFRLCTSLAGVVRNESAEKGEAALDRLHGYISALGPDGMRGVCLSRAHVERLLLALCQVAHVDPARISPVSEQSEDGRPRLPLKFVRNQQKLMRVCECLGRVGDPNAVVDYLLEWIAIGSQLDVAALVVLRGVLTGICEMPECPVGDRTIEAVLDASLERLSGLQTDRAPTDARIEDAALRISADTARACEILHIVALCAATARMSQTDAIMLRCLYRVLVCAASAQPPVADAAVCTLRELARLQRCATVQELLMQHADYLVYAIGVKLRHPETNPEAPRALLVCIKNGRREMLPMLKACIEETLLALDAQHAHRCLLLLRVLSTLLKAVALWFPRHPDPRPSPLETPNADEPTEEDGHEPTRKLPLHIELSRQILTRTKHLVSSSHLPIRLAVLDLIESGLRALASRKDELLPMVHQNWAGVLARFHDAEKHVAVEAVGVIRTMSRLSGSFVYRRIADEFVPRLRRFLTDQSATSRRAGLVYEQTGDCKLQLALLTQLPDVYREIEARPEDYETPIALCKLYTEDRAQPTYLRDAALVSLDRLVNLKHE